MHGYNAGREPACVGCAHSRLWNAAPGREAEEVLGLAWIVPCSPPNSVRSQRRSTKNSNERFFCSTYAMLQRRNLKDAGRAQVDELLLEPIAANLAWRDPIASLTCKIEDL